MAVGGVVRMHRPLRFKSVVVVHIAHYRATPHSKTNVGPQASILGIAGQLYITAEWGTHARESLLRTTTSPPAPPLAMSDKEADQSDIAMSDLRAVHPDPMQAAERGYAKVGLEEPTSDTVELRHLRTGSVSSQPGYDDASEHLPHPTLYQQVQSRRRVFWNRFTGKGREVPGFFRSLKNIVMSSCECARVDRSTHTHSCRDKHVLRLHSVGLDIPLDGFMVARCDIHSYVCDTSGTKMVLTRTIQFASLLLFPSRRCSTGVESKWLYSSAKTWETSLSSR